MLPSRGLLKSGSAPILRNGWCARTQCARPLQLPIRHFSQKPSPSSVVLNRLRCASSTIPASLFNSRATVATTITASSVFAQRSGASRNLSLWPFSSKPKPPTDAQTPFETSTEPSTLASQYEAPSNSLLESHAASTSSSPASSYTSPSTPADSPALDSVPQFGDAFDGLDMESVLDIPEQIGYLKSLGLDFGWGPTSCCQWVLEHIYIYSGMPWWATLATVAILWRAAMFFPTLTSSKHAALVQQVSTSPAYIQAKAEMDEAMWRTGDRVAQMRAREKIMRLKKETGASMMKSLVAVWTVPFSYGMFRIFRAMAAIPVPSLETGGFAWFTDLTVHDPYFILPISSLALAALMFKQTQATQLVRSPMADQMAWVMKWVLPPMMFLCTAWLPAGIQWFFLLLTAGTVVQTSATLNPGIRRWAGLPPLPIRGLGPTGAAGATGPIWQAPTPSKPAPSSEGIASLPKSLLGVDKQKEEWKKAQAYEERRAMEEKEKEYRRMEELRRRRSGRRS